MVSVTSADASWASVATALKPVGYKKVGHRRASHNSPILGLKTQLTDRSKTRTNPKEKNLEAILNWIKSTVYQDLWYVAKAVKEV